LLATQLEEEQRKAEEKGKAFEVKCMEKAVRGAKKDLTSANRLVSGLHKSSIGVCLKSRS
jgi:hypothetical protein